METEEKKNLQMKEEIEGDVGGSDVKMKTENKVKVTKERKRKKA